MSRRLAALPLLAWALLAPAAAQASFGLESFSVAAEKQGGGPESQAGAHPYAFHVDVGLGGGGGGLRSLALHLPPGFLPNPGAVPECSATAFAKPRVNPFEPGSQSGESCPDQAQLGTIAVQAAAGSRTFGLFNLAAPYGAAAAFGASPFHQPFLFATHLREGDSGIDVDLEAPQALGLSGFELTIWGRQPWDYSHDSQRGNCLNEENPAAGYGTAAKFAPYLPGTCTIGSPAFLEEHGHSYLTLPTTPCGAADAASALATSWQGASDAAQAGLPPLGNCHESVAVPRMKLSSTEAAHPSGLEFTLDVNDGGGILNPEGMALPAIQRTVLTLPDGLTLNPSLAAGLGTCSEAQFAAETASAPAGAGCQGAAKIGSVALAEPLGLPTTMRGSLYLATPYANPMGALMAVYLVVREPRRGLAIRSIGEIQPDARGRLTATFEQLPRLLYERFTLTLREGQRSALISPPACGVYGVDLALSSWAQPAAVRHEPAQVTILSGSEGSACPSAAAPPFHPGLIAGSLNPAAATYTPFYLRMTRTDAEQEITSYSATFPPGLLAKIAGVTKCPEAAIAAAKGRSGAAEEESPSCPSSSRIGRTMAGYGVGSALAWAPGGLYLAGPWHGASLSVVAIDSAKIGPFDLGTVVVREAVRIDPRSAQASIDAGSSDPIPHLLHGFPLHLRDIRVYLDRPGFTLNGTSCDPLKAFTTLGGAGANPFDPGDDDSASSSQRFQLLDCRSLGFRPPIAVGLHGGTRRGATPSLRVVVRPHPGEANIRFASVKLPPSLFLAQNHIRGVCTRAQFAAGAGGGSGCPKRSIYGRAAAWSPLLGGPLRGPVYLRSSSHLVPDLMVSLRGEGVSIVLEGKIDAVSGGLRGTFADLPDAPVSKFVMQLPGGRRGLLAVSGNLCAHRQRQRANARWIAQDNATAVLGPRLGVACHGGPR